MNLPFEQVFPLVPHFPGEHLWLLLPGVQSTLRSLKELVLVFVSLGRQWRYDGLAYSCGASSWRAGRPVSSSFNGPSSHWSYQSSHDLQRGGGAGHYPIIVC